MTGGEFTRFLVDHGLAAAGSNETIQDLKQRYGVRRWFEFMDVIDLPPASLFPEQTEPFFFLTNQTCLLPPIEFECDFDYHRNGPRTHACALKRLTALFGTPEKGVAVNTLSETWKFERMSITIRTFLPEKTRGRNDLYLRHPELWNFCRISIDRNLIRPMTEPDLSTLDSLGPSEMLPIDRGFWPTIGHLAMWERGLFRLAGNGTMVRPETPPFLWKQAGGIGWCAGPWSAIFERSCCLWLRLEQVTPARSRGYSRLVLGLRNTFSLEQEAVDTVVLTGLDTHSLDRVAPVVSSFWELPMRTEQYADD